MLPGLLLSLALPLAAASAGADPGADDPTGPDAPSAGPEEAIPARAPVDRVHDIRDLLAAPPRLAFGPDPATSELLLEPGTVPAACVPEDPAAGWGSGPSVGPSVEGGALDGMQVVAWILAHVDPEVWETADGFVEARGSALTVTAPAETQAEVERLLEALRSWRGRRFRVELAQVPDDALGPLADRVGEPVDPADFDRAIERAGDRAGYASFLLRDGQSTRRFSGRVRATLGDYEVNQTGMLPLTNPVIFPEARGRCFEAAVAGAGPGPWAILRVAVSRVEEEGEAEVRATPLGELELIGARRDALEATVLLPAGSAMVVGRTHEAVSEGPPRAEAWLVRVLDAGIGERGQAGGEGGGRAPAPDDRPVHAVHDGAWLAWPSPAGPALGSGSLVAPSEGDVESLVDSLREGLRIAVGAEADAARITPEGGVLLVTATPAVHRALDRWLLERLRARAIHARLLLEVREEAAGGDGDAQPAGVPGGRVVACVELAGVPGSDLRAFAHGSRGDLADCQWLSGGCFGPGFAAPDPVVAASWTGLAVRARASGAVDPARVGTELELSLFARGREGTAVAMVPSDVQRPPADGAARGGDPTLGMTRVLLPWEVDRVRTERGGVRGRFVLEAERAIELGRDAPRPGARRLVTATARWVHLAPSAPAEAGEGR